MSDTSNKIEFAKLLLASFISLSGSYFLTISISAYILKESGSPINSAMVFVAAYFPAILVSGWVGTWIDRHISKKLLISVEFFAIGTSILCGFIVQQKIFLIFLWLVMGVRSILTFTNRAGITKCIKSITVVEKQSNRIKLYYLSYFLSTAIAGCFAGWVLKTSSLLNIVVINIMTYLLSIAVLFSLSLQDQPAHSLDAVKSNKIGSVFTTLQAIFSQENLGSHFLFVICASSLFQGAYSALVSILPIVVFNLNPSGIGKFQVAASIGITSGFVLLWVFPNVLRESKLNGWPYRAVGVVLLTFGFLMSSVSVPSVKFSMILFLLMNFLFETLWLFNNSEFFRNSPKDRMGEFQFVLTSTSGFLISISTLGYSAFIQFFGVRTGVFGFFILLVLFLLGIRLVLRMCFSKCIAVCEEKI